MPLLAAARLSACWLAIALFAESVPGSEWRVTSPPSQLALPPYYKKYVGVDGYPIVASEKVNDYALKEAAYLVRQMLSGHPGLREAMIRSGSHLTVMAYDEFTTDVPEHARLQPKDYWDARARGLGGSLTDAICSCGEENLLGFPGDPYAAECILIHEFAHNIHLRGMVNLDPTFDDRVRTAYERAIQQGLWKGKYAAMNPNEYFAEGVQSWFSNNRENDNDHNHVNTREELIAYDPALAALCHEVFGDTKITYTRPVTRLRDHLAGYDPSRAPQFEWPERLRQAQDEIRAQAAERGAAAR